MLDDDRPSSTGETREKPSPSNSMGPVLPDSLRQSDSEFSDNEGSDTNDKGDDMYGPALPPGFKQNLAVEKPVVGPTLPLGLTKDILGSSSNFDDDSSSNSGGFAEIIGPLPPPSCSQGSGHDDVYVDFERRASKMKKKLTACSDQELKREEWMTVLPPELGKNFGLGPRSFRRQTPKPSGDRSVWTDTPSQKLGKEQHDNQPQDTVEKSQVKDTVLEDTAREKYDKEMNQRIEKYNKTGKRTKSLLEIHQKNLKKKKKEEKDKVVERRPFDRDVDLKVNLVDNAKRDALIKRSRQLNDKFSHGKGQFL